MLHTLNVDTAIPQTGYSVAKLVWHYSSFYYFKTLITNLLLCARVIFLLFSRYKMSKVYQNGSAHMLVERSEGPLTCHWVLTLQG